MTQDEWHAAGEPLLDPITGQPYSEAQLNPPMKAVAVPLTPDQKKQADNAAAIEQRAADLARQAQATTTTAAK